MRQYIDFNTQKRAGAKNVFEKDFFKLMDNIVYGKTCENLRKRVDVRLVTDQHTLPNFHYNYIKKRYNNKAKLLFIDTDSLCYEIETQDIYGELWQDRNLFDNSDYPKDSKFFY